MRTFYHGNALSDVLHIAEYLFPDVNAYFAILPRHEDTDDSHSFYSTTHKTKNTQFNILELYPEEMAYTERNLSMWISSIALVVSKNIEVPEDNISEVVDTIATEIIDALEHVMGEDPTDSTPIADILKEKDVPRSVYNVKSYSDVRKDITNEQ